MTEASTFCIIQNVFKQSVELFSYFITSKLKKKDTNFEIVYSKYYNIHYILNLINNVSIMY